MYANLLEEYVIPIRLSSAKLTLGDRSTNVLDVILTSDATGNRYVYSIVNKDPKREIELELDFNNINKQTPQEITGTILSGESPDDYNDIGAENRVIPQKKTFVLKNSKIKVPPHSLVFLSIE